MGHKTSRREAKESIHWLKLILIYNDSASEAERVELIEEADQIKKNYLQFFKNLAKQREINIVKYRYIS